MLVNIFKGEDSIVFELDAFSSSPLNVYLKCKGSNALLIVKASNCREGI